MTSVIRLAAFFIPFMRSNCLNRGRRLAPVSCWIVWLFIATNPSATRAADLFLVRGFEDEVDVTALGLRLNSFRTWTFGREWEYALSGEVQIGSWRGRDSQAGNRHIADTSFTPMLKLHSTSGKCQPYVELGIGAHLLSHTATNGNRHFGTAFQFGEFLGAGLDFGSRTQWGLGVRIQHVSNGGIKEPNDGITFGEMLIRYGY
jgi:lipid A 3-O-deacylase